MADLVAELGRGPRGIAVAQNAVVVARSAWTLTVVATGDRIEVLHAVQGGC
ncbi:MAG: sulfur carrier protein ThiS [Acidimicrobiales bacterium]